MIDLHTHILPSVDDGSAKLEYSLNLLAEAQEQGVTDLILTPHRRRKYRKSKEQLLEEFEAFCIQKEQHGLTINLYLGQEIYIGKSYKSDFINGEILPLCNGKFVLIEFDFIEETDISEVVYDIVKLGYIPIIAHFERYAYSNVDVARELKSLGGLIQINAQSLVGKGKFKLRKKISQLFKDDLVDFVASDIHYGRKNYTKKAYAFVSRKYGKQTAENLFKHNAEKIIEG